MDERAASALAACELGAEIGAFAELERRSKEEGRIGAAPCGRGDEGRTGGGNLPADERRVVNADAPVEGCSCSETPSLDSVFVTDDGRDSRCVAAEARAPAEGIPAREDNEGDVAEVDDKVVEGVAVDTAFGTDLRTGTLAVGCASEAEGRDASVD